MNKPQTSNFKFQNKSQIQNPKTERIFDLRERLFYFSKRIVKISRSIPQNRLSEGICIQLIKSGTAIGANFEEADGTITKKDFINKVSIARKEAKEARYWLRLIGDQFINRNEIIADVKECEEIINILSTILIRSGFKKRY